MIVVFGSINIDLVVQVLRLPATGETITGTHFFTAPGGKGANQAVACARLGASTSMIGRVGNDEFGSTLKRNLEDAGVNTNAVMRDAETSSGVALIAVEASGQNNIIVVPGANGRVAEEDLARLEKLLPVSKLLLLQLEIPLDLTLQAVVLARRYKVPVMLDPAPAMELPPALLLDLDFLTPNEVEAAQLVGFPVKDKADARRAADRLLTLGVKNVIIKMGASGLFYASSASESYGFVPPFPVRAIDTVAAGDAFNGGLAVAISEGLAFSEAVRWGAATAALSTTKQGAQSSMPDRKEVLSLLSH